MGGITCSLGPQILQSHEGQTYASADDLTEGKNLLHRATNALQHGDE